MYTTMPRQNKLKESPNAGRDSVVYDFFCRFSPTFMQRFPRIDKNGPSTQSLLTDGTQTGPVSLFEHRNPEVHPLTPKGLFTLHAEPFGINLQQNPSEHLSVHANGPKKGYDAHSLGELQLLPGGFSCTHWPSTQKRLCDPGILEIWQSVSILQLFVRAL